MSAFFSLREFDGARLLRPAPTQRQADAATREAKDRELSALMRAPQLGDRAAYTRLLREIMPLLQRLLRASFGSCNEPIGTTSCKTCCCPC